MALGVAVGHPTPSPASDFVVLPPSMQALRFFDQPHDPLHWSLQLILLQSIDGRDVVLTSAVPAVVSNTLEQPGPSPASDAVVRPPNLQMLYLLDHPHAPLH